MTIELSKHIDISIIAAIADLNYFLEFISTLIVKAVIDLYIDRCIKPKQ